MGRVINLTGDRFGRLTVLNRVGKDKYNNVMWECKCDCGKTIITRGSNLRNGKTKSCGCLHIESARSLSKLNTKHNKINTRLYHIWQCMKSRCYYKRNNRYKYYGERGIKVCNEWLNDFMSFYTWSISHGYKDNLTIDRIDCNGNYEPNNCRWTSNKQQQRNKHNNRNITIQGETHCLSEWCDILGLNVNTVNTRLRRNWSIERALELKC